MNTIPYLEERLYMLELLVSDIQYPQAMEFLTILGDLLDLGSFEEEELEKNSLRNLTQDRVANSFILYMVNPLKIIVMVIDIMQKIKA